MAKKKEMSIKQTAKDLGTRTKIPMSELMADRSLNQPIKSEGEEEEYDDSEESC